MEGAEHVARMERRADTLPWPAAGVRGEDEARVAPVAARLEPFL